MYDDYREGRLEWDEEENRGIPFPGD